MMIDPVIVRASQAALAILFGVTAISKLASLRRFEDALASYGLVPQPLVPLVAIAIALLEFGVAIALPFDAVRHAAALIGLGLLTLFFGAIAFNLARGRRDIQCGCWAFGQKAKPSAGGISPWHLWRLALLAAMLAPCLLDPSDRPIVWIDYLTVLGSLLAAGGLLFATELLLANGAAAQP